MLPDRSALGRCLNWRGNTELSFSRCQVLRINHSSTSWLARVCFSTGACISIDLQMINRPGTPWHCHWCHWCSTAWPSHCPGQALPGSRALHPWP